MHEHYIEEEGNGKENKWLKSLKKKGCFILNGNKEGNEKGNYIYRRRKE